MQQQQLQRNNGERLHHRRKKRCYNNTSNQSATTYQCTQSFPYYSQPSSPANHPSLLLYSQVILIAACLNNVTLKMTTRTHARNSWDGEHTHRLMAPKRKDEPHHKLLRGPTYLRLFLCQTTNNTTYNTPAATTTRIIIPNRTKT